MFDDYLKKQLPKEFDKWRTLALYGGDKSSINLSHNDYLGVGDNIDLSADFTNRVLIGREYGDIRIGSTSSRMLFVNSAIYSNLESRLAEAYTKQAALLFNSGYHANLGILPALTNKKSLILADKLIHASIIDGMRLSDGDKLRYRHNDYQHLNDILELRAGDYEAVFIVTESIFSMDGDVADLAAIVAIKKQYNNVYLYVDEAHAFGVRGSFGLGLASELSLLADIDILVGTFGKSYASAGAFVVGRKMLVDVLVNSSRTLIFSTAFSPINAAWALYLLDKSLSKNDDEMERKRVHLASITSYIKGKFEVDLIELSAECGCENQKLLSLISVMIDYLKKSNSHIIPVVVGCNELALALAEYLKQNDVVVKAIRPPTVPVGSSRVRLSLSANLRVEDVDTIINLIITYLKGI